MNSFEPIALKGTNLNSFEPVELKGTWGNLRELEGTRGNLRELVGTQSFSMEALVEVIEGKKLRKRGEKTQQKG